MKFNLLSDLYKILKLVLATVQLYPSCTSNTDILVFQTCYVIFTFMYFSPCNFFCLETHPSVVSLSDKFLFIPLDCIFPDASKFKEKNGLNKCLLPGRAWLSG